MVALRASYLESEAGNTLQWSCLLPIALGCVGAKQTHQGTLICQETSACLVTHHFTALISQNPKLLETHSRAERRACHPPTPFLDLIFLSEPAQPIIRTSTNAYTQLKFCACVGKREPRYGFNKNSPSALIRMCKEEICLSHHLLKTCVGSNTLG